MTLESVYFSCFQKENEVYNVLVSQYNVGIRLFMQMEKLTFIAFSSNTMEKSSYQNA